MKTTIQIILCALLTALLPAHASVAQADPGATEQRISLEFKDAKLSKVMEALAGTIGADIAFDPAAEREVTFAFDNLTIHTALDALCESSGCAWTLVEGATPVLKIDLAPPTTSRKNTHVRERRSVRTTTSNPTSHASVRAKTQRERHDDQETVTTKLEVELRDAPAQTILTTLARVMNAELVMSPELTERRITMNTEASVEAVLDEVCAAASCRWALRDEGTRRVLEVTAAP